MMYVGESSSNDSPERSFVRHLMELQPVFIEYLIRKCNANPEDARDAAQDAAVNLLMRFRARKLADVRSSRAYMLRVVRNTYYRNHRAQSTIICDFNEHYAAHHAPVCYGDYDEVEISKILDECLRKLPQKQQEVFRFWMENKQATTECIAKRFELTPSGVFTIMHRITRAITNHVMSRSRH